MNQNFDDDESGDDDFNPASPHGSDDEADSDRVKNEQQRRDGSDRKANRRDIKRDSDDEKPNDRSSLVSRPRPQANGADDEAEEDANGEEEGEDGDEDAEGEGEDLGDGDDDDEDEDEDDDEDDVGRPRKRFKRRRGNQFIDVEAEVDDEEDEEEPEEEDLAAEDAHPDDIDLPAGAETDDRHHRELDRRRELAATLDAETQAKRLVEKYGKRTRTAEVSAIPQHLLLPSVDDPSIWAVKCKPGKENEVVAQIWKNYFNYLRLPEKFNITAAFARGGQQSGFIYVEAKRQEDVLKATDNVTFCYNRAARGVSNLQKIAINEMPDLLRVRKPQDLVPGMWVRIIRPPKYAGDLGQVDSVDANGTDLTVKLVPRIDYGLEEDLNGPAGGMKRKRRARPLQRLFNEHEAKKRMSRNLVQHRNLKYKHFTFQNENYIDGYLFKDLKVNQIEAEDVKPTMEEMLLFRTGAEDGSEALDIGQMASILRNDKSGADFQADDEVEIYQGEAVGVQGRVVTIQNGIVTLNVTKGPLRGQNVETPVKTVRKLFEIGKTVKVVGGVHNDAEGMVTAVHGDKVTIFTDNQNRIEVFSRDLRDASAATAAHVISKYQHLELVQLDASTVAVVIKVESEVLTVMDQNGNVRQLPPSSIPQKVESRRVTVAADRDGNEVRVGDTVRESSGENRQGSILHIWRHFLFLRDRTTRENSGVFVARSHSVNTVAVKGGEVRNAGPDLTKMNPLLKQNGANGAGSMPPPPKFAGRDDWLGKTVAVKTGPLKAKKGLVKDSTNDSCTVEMEGIISGPKVRDFPKSSK